MSNTRQSEHAQAGAGAGANTGPWPADRSLRILLVTGFFAPYAPSGATRMPHLASYWQSRGHDVHVLGAANPNWPPVLTHDLTAERVHQMPYTRVDGPLQMLAYRLLGKVPTPPSAPPQPAHLQPPPPEPAKAPATARAGPPSLLRRLKDWLAFHYRQLLILPDMHVYWAEQAATAIAPLLETWRPDFIYASSPPHSSQVLAARLSARFGVPWISELRDEWSGNPYSATSALRGMFEKPLERRTLSTATAMVALTGMTRDTLARRYGKPVALVMNGFEPDDFCHDPQPAPLDPTRLTILHAGSIYVGKRDPAVLFDAVAQLGDLARHIDMRFYGEAIDALPALAERYGVAGQLTVSGPIARSEILRLEQAADVLLLCRWDNPIEDGVIPGKLFEYIGARRPVLVIGSETGEAANIVRDGGFGLVSNEAGVICQQLRAWIEQKNTTPRLPDLDAARAGAYTREAQFGILDGCIAQWTRDASTLARSGRSGQG